MPALYNFLGGNRVWRGNTFPITFTFKNSDGTAVDLTGSTIRIRIEDAAGTTVIDTAMTVAAPASGQATITLSSVQTRALTSGSGNRYEVERRINSTETTLVYGNITAEGGVNTDA